MATMKYLFLLISIHLFAQQSTYQTLLEQIKDKPDTAKIRMLNEFCWKYRAQDQLSAFKSGEEALRISKKIKDRNLEAKSLNLIGLLYRNQGKYDKSISTYNEALEIAESVKDSTQIAYANNNIGGIYRLIGNSNVAFEYMLKGLNIFEKFNDKLGISFCTINIGMNYSKQQNYVKALEYLNYTIKIREELNDVAGHALAVNLVADIQLEMDSIGLAMSSYKVAEKEYVKVNDKKGLANIWGGLGNIFKIKKDYPNALKYCARALQLSKKINYLEGIVSNYNNIGRIYFQTGSFEKAQENIGEALKIASQLRQIGMLVECYKNLADLYENRKDYSTALYYNKKYSVIKDSLKNERNAQLAYGMESVYQNQKINIENTLLHKENENKEQLLRYYFVIILFISLALFFAYWRYRSNKSSSNKLGKLYEALKESETRYRLLFHNLPVGVMHYDTELCITDCNDHFIDILQSSREKLIGLKMKKLQDQNVLPALSEVLKGKSGFYEGLYNATTSKAEIWITMRSTPLLDNHGRILGGVCIVEDISERKISEEKLIESEEKFRVLFLHSSSATLIVEPDTTITMVNEELCKISGYTEKELIGMSWTRVITQEDIERMIEYNRKRLINPNDVPSKYECTMIHKNGEVKHVLLSASLLLHRKLIVTIVDISERKRAEEAIMKLSKAVEHSPATIVITDKNGNIEYVNPKFCEITGYTAEEAISKNPRILKSGKTKNVIYEELWSTILSGKEWRGEFINKKKNNELYWESASISPIIDSNGEIKHFIAVKEDITERKRIDEALRESEERWRSIVGSEPECVKLLDREGRLLEMNPAGLAMIQATSDQVLGKKVVEIVAPENQDVFNEMVEAVFRGETRSLEFDVIGLEGRRLTLETTSCPLKDISSPGDVKTLLGVTRDITERKRAEHIIKQQNLELLDLNTSKDKFFSIIAHDLKSPFNGFLGLTKIMAEEFDDLTPKEMQYMAGQMKTSAKNLYALLDNLLEWASMQRGSTKFCPEVTMLDFVIKQNINIVTAVTNQKNIHLEYNVPENYQVFADNSMLNTIFRNLISNAIKFTPRGGSVTVGILESSGFHQEFTTAYVKDTGIGMNDEILSKLFKIEEKVNRQGTESEPSSGLGLVLCKEFIEKHSGKIWVESKVGAGTTFYFTIPNVR